ncbi:MAG: hypothetical protein JWL59_2562 [Chthoniobacteraceae bacterium]|nr:hypothetical protein [Chthoniobacteraceae bacterium]
MLMVVVRMRFVEVDFIAMIVIKAVHVFGMITIRPMLMFLMLMRMRFVTMVTIRSMNVCLVHVMAFRSMNVFCVHVFCVAMIALRSVHMVLVGMAGVRFFILVMGMGRTGMNAELDSFDALALLALEMHVEIADLQFGEFPLKSGRFDSQVAQGSHGHVAADTGKAVEKKNTHDEVFKKLKN